MNKVVCAYTKHFFVQIYKSMVENEHNFVTDASNTVWHILDVEEILIKEHGLRKSQLGSLIN